MSKMKTVFEKHPILLIFLLFIIIIGVLMFPFSDGYLMLKIMYGMLGSIVVGVVALFIVKNVSKKKKEKLSIIQVMKKNIVIILTTIIIAMIVFCYRPCIDIKIGPQKGKMINTFVKEKYHTLYLDGAMKGEMVKFKVTGAAAERLKSGDLYYSLEIEYYKNIKEVFRADRGWKSSTWN